MGEPLDGMGFIVSVLALGPSSRLPGGSDSPYSRNSADYMQGTHVKFNSKADAIAFCEKQGWEFYVQEPNVQKFEPKSYAK